MSDDPKKPPYGPPSPYGPRPQGNSPYGAPPYGPPVGGAPPGYGPQGSGPAGGGGGLPPYRGAAEMPPGYGEPRYPQGPVPDATFRRLAFFNEDEGVGARWWQQQLASAGNPMSRRSALTKMALIGTAVGATLAAGSCVAIAIGTSATQDVEANLDALDVQKAEGWDVGVIGQLPLFPAATEIDVNNSGSWKSALDSLDTSLKPETAGYQPYYVPTLFQVLGSSNGSGLKSAIRPILTAEMDAAFARGKALASLFDDQARVALVIDLPGPEAIAFAAGAAERFEPVFVFDNWPHPLGVVPAHLTLAAALYFHAIFAATRKSASKRAPAFVLDRNRLASYGDETAQFDNRYMAKLPPSDRLSSMAKNILYVTPTDTTVTAAQELDDINDDLVAFAKQGLDVRAVAITSFLAPDGSVPTASLLGDAGVPTPTGKLGKDGGPKDASLDGQVAEPDVGTAPLTMNAGMANADAGVDAGAYVPRSPRHSTTVYYYGGYPHTHWYFWHTYSWYSPPAARYATAPRLTGVASAYRPISRPTMFSSRAIGGSSSGIGRAKPTGFGRVSVLQAHGGGPVTATRFGGGGRSYPSGRSGSWGRSGGWGGTS